MFQNEIFIRMGFFFGILCIMMLLEVVRPKRRFVAGRQDRWWKNLTLTFLNAGLLRVLFPLTAVAFAFFLTQQEWGLFFLMNMPTTLKIILGVIILDCVIYFQHRLFHVVPLLFRLHKVHHTDVDFDVTTALRFHSVEILLSMCLKFLAIFIFGIPALGVLIFEILLNGVAMFNHANIQIPKSLDRILRVLIVTPDMHRVHHSHDYKEGNSNFGFNLPWWDYLFRTYIAQPKKTHEKMDIGLPTYPKNLSFWRMITLPFLNKKDAP